MAVRQTDLLQGTLDLLVLRCLGSGRNHGYGIANRIHLLSDEVLRIEEGSLYPSLYRMEELSRCWRRTSRRAEWRVWSP